MSPPSFSFETGQVFSRSGIALVSVSATAVRLMPLQQEPMVQAGAAGAAGAASLAEANVVAKATTPSAHAAVRRYLVVFFLFGYLKVILRHCSVHLDTPSSLHRPRANPANFFI